ncbi:MAG: hypothetical protein H7222_06395 [Methylotenera sp.]|nr:hypothetical protein [Oligoflexia bacterium]
MNLQWVTHLKNICSDFAGDERGQSTTEYILILSVVVMIAIKFKGAIEKQVLGKLMNGLNSDLDKFGDSSP